jgi:hypothetical protein
MEKHMAKIRKARNAYTCYNCNASIPKGSQYQPKLITTYPRVMEGYFGQDRTMQRVCLECKDFNLNEARPPNRGEPGYEYGYNEWSSIIAHGNGGVIKKNPGPWNGKANKED